MKRRKKISLVDKKMYWAIGILFILLIISIIFYYRQKVLPSPGEEVPELIPNFLLIVIIGISIILFGLISFVVISYVRKKNNRKKVDIKKDVSSQMPYDNQ